MTLPPEYHAGPPTRGSTPCHSSYCPACTCTHGSMERKLKHVTHNDQGSNAQGISMFVPCITHTHLRTNFSASPSSRRISSTAACVWSASFSSAQPMQAHCGQLTQTQRTPYNIPLHKPFCTQLCACPPPSALQLKGVHVACQRKHNTLLHIPCCTPQQPP
jgi:hypothetical protein